MLSKTEIENLRKQYNSEETELRKIQLRMLDMLLYIDEICRNNNIDYWISDGTLLGAYRHGGFIPWDDDVDISMPREDLKRFKEIMMKAPSSEFVFQDSDTDKYYYSPYSKVRDLRTVLDPKYTGKVEDRMWVYKGLWVDIFPYEECHPVLNRIAFYTNTWGRRFYSRTPNKLAQFFGKMRVVVNNMLILPFLRLFTHLSFNEGIYTMALGMDWCCSYPMKDIFPLSTINFEGHVFKCPNNPPEVLKRWYGKNYMQLPPQEKRGGHSMRVTWIDDKIS